MYDAEFTGDSPWPGAIQMGNLTSLSTISTVNSTWSAEGFCFHKTRIRNYFSDSLSTLGNIKKNYFHEKMQNLANFYGHKYSEFHWKLKHLAFRMRLECLATYWKTGTLFFFLSFMKNYIATLYKFQCSQLECY